ncbi:hypothetical protein ILYODFUR_019862 [Ilyodon furcidens]|uniref:Uncharacterized protein n=1 Tax=Ilyodon furcidens TaxID=33524 RepID=A0ABV0U6U0_9TELE
MASVAVPVKARVVPLSRRAEFCCGETGPPRTSQSKQIDHACFSRSSDITWPLPFPPQVNRKERGKRSCQPP